MPDELDVLRGLAAHDLEPCAGGRAEARGRLVARISTAHGRARRRSRRSVLLLVPVVLLGTGAALGGARPELFRRHGAATGGSVEIVYRVGSERVEAAAVPPPALTCRTGAEYDCVAGGVASGRGYRLLRRTGAPGATEGVSLLAADGRSSWRPAGDRAPWIVCRPAAGARWRCLPLVRGATVASAAPLYVDAAAQASRPGRVVELAAPGCPGLVGMRADAAAAYLRRQGASIEWRLERPVVGGTGRSSASRSVPPDSVVHLAGASGDGKVLVLVHGAEDRSDGRTGATCR